MNTVVIIQARLTSQRLPGKILKPIGPMVALAHTVYRAQASGFKTVLAVPQTQQREIMDQLWPHPQAKPWDLGPMPVYAGSEHDVLARMTMAAMAERADSVVRLTGDCPFVDPRMVWACADAAAHDKCYVANCIPEHRTEPRGLDVEAFPMWALVDADLYAQADTEREHVTPWIREHIKQEAMLASTNRPDLRWVLDTQDDYDWFCQLATMIDCTPPHPTTRELLAFLQVHPEMERKDG